MKVFEAFAGIGTQRIALKNLTIDHEVVGISEIDKFAIKSYEAIHGPTPNYGDIKKIDPAGLPDFDLFTFSFPCQDISSAGNQKGFEAGSSTRSSLLWECQKIIENKKPKYLLMENVKNLVSKKFKPHFESWLEYLESLGYTNYWQVLNAKDFNIPQNRERVIAISILGDTKFSFPATTPLSYSLKDILELNVDKKYYLPEERAKKLIMTNKELEFGYIPYTENGKKHQSNTVYKDEISPTITSSTYKEPPKIIQVGNIIHNQSWENPQRGRIYSPAGISPSLVTVIDSIPKIYLPTIGASRGRNPNHPSDRTTGIPTKQRLEINKNNISNTLTTIHKDNLVIEPTYRIRKLTPLECWRLMGISDTDFYKAQEVVSNTQLYKQAGNAIVVQVLEAVFKQLFI